MIKNILKSALFALMLMTVCLCYAEDNMELKKQQAIAQMNYNIGAITSIIEDHSIEVLDYELDQLLNNLSVAQVIDLSEIKDFRESMLEKWSNLQITAEERILMRQIQSMRRENMMWLSMSKALNPTMILTSAKSAKQAAFYIILGAARTAVEYKSAQGEADIEELQAMWELKKRDLGDITQLRKDAMEATFKLYQRFNLNEEDRLTEETAKLFNDIITDTNTERKVRRLLDYYNTYKGIQAYYYHLGMAYVDLNQYKMAKSYLNTYIHQADSIRMFRHDAKLGCVYLTELAYNESLSKTQKIEYIRKALTNLPNNGAAIIQCAMIYHDAGFPREAFKLLRQGIDNPFASDKNCMVMLVSTWMKELERYPDVFAEITHAIKTRDDISFNAYLSFLMNSKDQTIWEECDNIISYEDALEHRLGWFGDWQISPSFYINLKKYQLSLNDIAVYTELVKDDEIYIKQLAQKYAKNIVSKEELKEKIYCFKTDTTLIYNFFTSVNGTNELSVKNNIEVTESNIYNFSGMSGVSERDAKKIIRIIKKNKPAEYDYSIRCDEYNGIVNTILFSKYNPKGILAGFNRIEKRLSYAEALYGSQLLHNQNQTIKFIGDSLPYFPTHIFEEFNQCVRIVFYGMEPVVLTYGIDQETDQLILQSIENSHDIHYRDMSKLTPISVNDTIEEVESEESSAEEKVDSTSFWEKIKFWGKSEDTTPESDLEEPKQQPQLEEPSVELRTDSTSFWKKLKFWRKSEDTTPEIDIDNTKEQPQIEEPSVELKTDSTSFWKKIKFWER